MSTLLYEHNQTAYEAALSMLRETGRAAVIHPTGTGKSFIAFRLCEEHPDAAVCWLSPSEYIFQTQRKNWVKAGGAVPENIFFLTYAKLTGIAGQELEGIRPDYIVLDEFHRCGARLWGQGVQRLLRAYPDAKMLGLTATNSRYLDNQRDMADELFDGNVASSVTLGEAVVRGILQAPKYVLSLYSLQEDMERLAERVRRTENRAVRDAAEKYMEELRRALEKADGLNVIFERHMPDRTGKYIVFCSNAAHMRQMMALAAEWFGGIDKNPHIYSVYASEPEAAHAFSAFAADEDREHLKLLYCIDALNEGIHLDDISGVILLRPTVSPIVFKQQIGRALSAGKKKNAVIFDIVLNINNLYSIGALEEEMQTAAAYYRSLGESDAIVQEHFAVIDEVRDCRILFEKLGEVLTASWSVMYGQAKRYYMENGDLDVPARFVTEDGYSLGHWIYNQRYIRKGVLDGGLTEEQTKMLDAIGMRWELLADRSWARHFAAAQRYYMENGDLNVPAKYKTADGIGLGQWLCTLRTWEKAGAHPKYLTFERKAQLDKIGMIWDKADRLWERNYRAACAYYEAHGNLDVPGNYADADGIRLGAWIGRMRTRRAPALTEEQILRLDAIGMIWKKRTDQSWERGFAAAEAYARTFKNLLVPVSYVSEDGVKLGAWIQRQRNACKKQTLSSERMMRLNAIGMVWDTHSWMRRFVLVKQYCREHGTADVPQNVVAEGCWVGKWLAQQRRLRAEGKLTGEQMELLSSLENFSRAV